MLGWAILFIMAEQALSHTAHDKPFLGFLGQPLNQTPCRILFGLCLPLAREEDIMQGFLGLWLGKFWQEIRF